MNNWLILAFLAVALALLPYVEWKELSDSPLVAGSGMGKEVKLPSRNTLLNQLKNENEFDILIIGGGATGAGAALEATKRGLKTALVEMDDFGAGTSSRSTKLLHGGVRYLKKAITKWDPSQLQLVKEALHERWNLFQQAPHLTNPIPILTPSYSLFDLVFSFFQLKLYDWIAYPHIHSSDYIPSGKAKTQFPQLKDEGLEGAVVYYDGQFDDARFNLAVVMSAIEKGATAVNRAQVVDMEHDNQGKVKRVVVQDRISGEKIRVGARTVVNAAGHFADEIRKLDDQNAVQILQASAGTHIVLNKDFCPRNEGLLITKTEDKRVIFLLPWHGATLAGTTDAPSNVTNNPRPTEAEIEYILNHINKYFAVQVNRRDVRSAWSGIRPLKKASDSKDTASVSREHAIYTSPSGLLTIVGGKWTTYRRMGQDIINRAVNVSSLNPTSQESGTDHIKLVGAYEYHEDASRALANMFELDQDVALHLNEAYGDQAYTIARRCLNQPHLCKRLVSNYPYIEAEVLHTVEREYALHPIDFLERRIRIALLDNEATLQALPRVIELMSSSLEWSDQRTKQMQKEAKDHLTISTK
eukprot:gb/GECH01000503.1/.p1 GENE.gb/GECH01000503.1/~~gb/GECH01000503.1/.p1  ORF type:complete len:584 (+),score=160.39 gb/GECH01000503.1/:1-1752(+)